MFPESRKNGNTATSLWWHCQSLAGLATQICETATANWPVLGLRFHFGHTSPPLLALQQLQQASSDPSTACNLHAQPVLKQQHDCCWHGRHCKWIWRIFTPPGPPWLHRHRRPSHENAGMLLGRQADRLRACPQECNEKFTPRNRHCHPLPPLPPPPRPGVCCAGCDSRDVSDSEDMTYSEQSWATAQACTPLQHCPCWNLHMPYSASTSRSWETPGSSPELHTRLRPVETASTASRLPETP